MYQHHFKLCPEHIQENPWIAMLNCFTSVLHQQIKSSKGIASGIVCVNLDKPNYGQQLFLIETDDGKDEEDIRAIRFLSLCFCDNIMCLHRLRYCSLFSSNFSFSIHLLNTIGL